MKKVVVAVLCFVLGAAVLLTGVMVFLLQSGWGGRVFEAELARSQNFSAARVDKLVMDYSSDSVTVLTSPTDEIILEEYFSSWDESDLALTNISGDTLQIVQNRRFVSGFGFVISYVKIYLPRDWNGAVALQSKSGSVRFEDDVKLRSLAAESSSGSVRLAGAEVEGDVVLAATSGGVSADWITAGGSVQTTSSSGSVRLGRVQAQDIYAKSSSGTVAFESAAAQNVEAQARSGGVKFGELRGHFRLTSSSGSVEVGGGAGWGEASTKSGTVRVSLEALEGSLNLSASSGGVRLWLPSDSSMDFSASTSSGTIKTPFDDALRFDSGGKKAAGEVSGGEHSVTCETSSGSVKVEWI